MTHAQRQRLRQPLHPGGGAVGGVEEGRRPRPRPRAGAHVRRGGVHRPRRPGAGAPRIPRRRAPPRLLRGGRLSPRADLFRPQSRPFRTHGRHRHEPQPGLPALRPARRPDHSRLVGRARAPKPPAAEVTGDDGNVTKLWPTSDPALLEMVARRIWRMLVSSSPTAITGTRRPCAIATTGGSDTARGTSRRRTPGRRPPTTTCSPISATWPTRGSPSTPPTGWWPGWTRRGWPRCRRRLAGTFAVEPLTPAGRRRRGRARGGRALSGGTPERGLWVWVPGRRRGLRAPTPRPRRGRCGRPGPHRGLSAAGRDHPAEAHTRAGPGHPVRRHRDRRARSPTSRTRPTPSRGWRRASSRPASS